MQYFNIQVASQLSGVATATIRAWEKRYHAVVPERAENKHRLYSEKDIEKLAILFKLTECGQSIGKIAHLEIEELKQIYSTLLHRPYDEKEVITLNHEKIDHSKVLTNLLLALSAYKIDILSHELDKICHSVNPREFCLDILIPLFQAIGSKVEKNELSIAQEHTISAIISFHIGTMLNQNYLKNFKQQNLVLIAAPEGELHEIGLLGAALLCLHHGVKFIFLGINLPAISLSEAANALHPKIILLGSTKINNLEGKPSLEEYIHSLQQNLNTNTEIWVGGNVKPYVRAELEKMRVTYLSTLHALDTKLEKAYSH
ncbi:MAG: MerR family transcriptional regulator [Bacteriovoracaceae bacterium]